MGTSRRQLRREISRGLKDLLTLTAADGSSDNKIVDPVELTDYDNSFAGSQVVCISSAHPGNVGKVSRVRGSSQIGNSLSIEPPMPDPIQTGDVFDMVNLRNRGFRVQDYNTQIEDVIQRFRDTAPREVHSAPFTFNAREPFVPIPDDWMTVHGVTQHIQDFTRDIHASRYDGARGWRVTNDRRIEISGQDRYDAHDTEVVVHGTVPHPPVVDDDDICHINPEFVSLTVRSELATLRGDNSWNQWSVEWARMAAGARPATHYSFKVNTVFLENEYS